MITVLPHLVLNRAEETKVGFGGKGVCFDDFDTWRIIGGYT